MSNTLGYQLASNSANPAGSFIVTIGSQGIPVLNKSNQNWNQYDVSNFKVKVIVTKNDGKYLVTSGTYATDNLTVNSSVDFLNAYNIVNLPDPTDSNLQYPATVNYMLNKSYLTQSSADSRYYLQTTKLNQIATPTASVNMGGQKLTGVGLATVSSDAVSLTQLQNYAPT